MTVSMKRILAAVYPPEKVGALVILSMAIVDKMDGNPYFPNPVPTLAKLKRSSWLDAATMDRQDFAHEEVTQNVEARRIST